MNRVDTDTAHRLWNEWMLNAGYKSELLNPCDLIRAAEDAFWAANHPCRVLLDDDFYIAAGTDHDKLWLGRLSGEGGDFDKEAIREMLVKFYEENF